MIPKGDGCTSGLQSLPTGALAHYHGVETIVPPSDPVQPFYFLTNNPFIPL